MGSLLPLLLAQDGPVINGLDGGFIVCKGPIYEAVKGLLAQPLCKQMSEQQ